MTATKPQPFKSQGCYVWIEDETIMIAPMYSNGTMDADPLTHCEAAPTGDPLLDLPLVNCANVISTIKGLGLRFTVTSMPHAAAQRKDGVIATVWGRDQG